MKVRVVPAFAVLILLFCIAAKDACAETSLFWTSFAAETPIANVFSIFQKPAVEPPSQFAEVSVTIGTNPAGLLFTVDGVTFTETQMFTWQVGSFHMLSTASPQGGGEIRYVWENWNDGGDQGHTIQASGTSTAFTANFRTQFKLTMFPPGPQYGTVSPATGFFDSGQSVQILATRAPGCCYNFWNWNGTGNGSYSGRSNPATVIMNGPIFESATFEGAPPTQTPTNTPTVTPTPSTTPTPTATPTATPLASIHFLSNSFSMAEGGTAQLQVYRSGLTSGTSKITFSTANGTATGGTDCNPGIDFISVSQDLTFVPGETVKLVYVATCNDSLHPEPEETIVMSLAGLNVVTPSTSVLTLNDRAPTIRAGFDYDRDNRADLSVYRPSNGVWYIYRSEQGAFALQLGNATDKVAPADYDGDRKTDIAVYRPSQGLWYVYNSQSATYSVTQFGSAEDLPVPGDYDGDGKADLAVYRPSDGTWYIRQSNAGLKIVQFGANGDVPVPGDFDGDGRNDLAVWRPLNGIWYERRSQLGDVAIQFGASTDKVVPADYDGDGRTDVAVYRPSTGTWYSFNSSDYSYPVTVFGLSTDVPVPGDYDGDGKADIAVWRPSNGQWWLNRSTSGLTVVQFGSAGDKPTENAFGN